MTTPRAALERAGIDVDALLTRLTEAAGAELAAVYRYTVLAVQTIGFTDEGVRDVLRDIRDENRRHFEALVTRVHELGGALPQSIRRFVALGGESPEEAQADQFAADPDRLLETLTGSLRHSVSVYAGLLDLTAGRDHRTHALAQAVHHEKSEHIAWLREVSGLGPPGRFHRGFRGRSPWLSRLEDEERE